MNNAALDSQIFDVPALDYSRRSISAGIVHFGIGNFFRSHLAAYTERCLSHAGQQHWGIVGVGLSGGARSEAKAAVFREQDGLYSLTEMAPDGTNVVRVIGAMIDSLLAPADPEAVLRRLADPAIRIVSMTITEGGYLLDQDNRFDADHPDVRHDLAHPERPRTVFGFVTEALRRRLDTGAGPFTVLSCDNLRSNGDAARAAFTGFARLRDPALAEWIDGNVSFPNAMVDRIAPTVSRELAAELNARSGLDDRSPVLAESFSQWVLEDAFCAGRPAWDRVGVQFSPAVHEWEAVKQRMLNASHMMLTFPGMLAGFRFVHEAMTEPKLVELLDSFMRKDVIPLLTPPEGVDLDAYRREVLARFSNAAMMDGLLRVGSDGASKIPVFMTATIRLMLEHGYDMRRPAFLIASYLEALRGRDQKGAPIPFEEPTLSDADRAAATGDDLDAALRIAPFAGWQRATTPAFTQAIRDAQTRLRERGVLGAIPE
ncbi:mannitol dehydrogenase family protein [Endosaccharibacter trunci]|uniref:mannitol dehydrogenase family protein n=1 Tax=Endosaccharibacter trunci TaxID=2812733 RepID=UPI003BF5FEE4